LVLVALAVILIKLVSVDIDVTRRERRLRRLLQKVAILELELKQLKARIEPLDATAPEARGAIEASEVDTSAPLH